MANIVVSTSGNSIIADFGDYAPITGSVKSSYDRAELFEIALNADYVMVYMNGQKEWKLSVSDPNYFIVDSVNGIAPSSLSDLFDKLSALRG